MPETPEDRYGSRGLSGPPDRGNGGRPRAVIIYASAGAGHDGASRELARRLRERGLLTDCVDLADVLPWGLGRLLRGTYHMMLDRAPWIYGLLFAIGGGFGRSRPATRALLRPVWRRIRGMLPPDTRLVVSTYPVVSQIVGPMRVAGWISVPVVTYLTDFAVNPIWVSAGVDLHCAAHQETREQARALGAAEVRICGRVVSPGCAPGTDLDRRRARERFGLPVAGRLALLVAGSWGVGEVARTAAEIAATGVAVPVVVCGRNAALRRRLRAAGVGYVFGWVDDMPNLLRAADVLVENAGGLTALEAMACGLPVATYRPIPGHGTANAVAMARAGVTTFVRRRAELAVALVDLVEGPTGRRQREAGLALFTTDPTGLIAGVARGDGRPADLVGSGGSADPPGSLGSDGSADPPGPVRSANPVVSFEPAGSTRGPGSTARGRFRSAHRPGGPGPGRPGQPVEDGCRPAGRADRRG